MLSGWMADDPKPKKRARRLVRRRDAVEFPGDWVAHYSSADRVFGNIVPERRLLMNPYKRMNDPAENKDLAVAVTRREQDDELAERLLEDTMLTRAVNDIRDMARLTSFSADDGNRSPAVFGCCWAIAPMWNHYADRHQGACLVFKRSQLQAAARSDENSHLALLLRQVKYTNGGIATAPLRDAPLPDDAPDELGAYVNRHADVLFFLKTADWAHEKEVRAMSFPRREDDGAGRLYFSFGDALEAVVLGERFPGWQLLSAFRSCENRGVRLLRVAWKQGRPATQRVTAQMAEAAAQDTQRRTSVLAELARSLPPSEPSGSQRP